MIRRPPRSTRTDTLFLYTTLFRSIRMVYRKAKPKGTLLKEFREHVGPPQQVAFIEEVLLPMAQAFREVTDADYASQKHAEAVNDALRWLNRIECKHGERQRGEMGRGGGVRAEQGGGGQLKKK